MKRIMTLLAIIILVVQLLGSVEVTDRNKVVMMEILQIIRQAHYEPQAYDDSYAERIFTLYLDRLDYRKRFFLQSDIDALAAYKTSIDDELASNSVDDKFAFYDQALDTFEQRVREVQGFYEEMLAQPFDYTVQESLETDAKKLAWCGSEAERRDAWRKWLKYQTIQRYFTLMDTRNKPVDANDDDINVDVNYLVDGQLDPEVEAEAREKVRKSTERTLAELLSTDSDDKFAVYANAILNAIDPHSAYMPPQDREDFDIDMTGQFEGIGARLTEEDGFVKITEIIPGSASYRQGELEANDKIIKVAQGEGEPVDVIDMPVDDAVKLIRGPKGTEVRLTVQKPSGEIVVIPLIRDVVVIEDTYAKYSVIEHEKFHKTFGYIRLPGFYRDFSGRVPRNSTDDVRKALEELNKSHVDGVILDLRNNGGGALRDAIDIPGLFIKTGPVVQVRDKIHGTQVYTDNDREVVYGGPLVILINQFSASASEILAAALQDYGRAVIVGSEQSFGKGTVQNLIDLDSAVRPAFNYLKPLGSLKLTIQKFYRINGGTTQWNGVHSDIVLPSTYDYLDLGERDYEYPLPYDSVNTVPYSLWQESYSKETLAVASEKRVEGSNAFQLIEHQNDRLEHMKEDSLVSLQLNEMITERTDNKREAKILRDNQVEHDYLTVLTCSDNPTDDAGRKQLDEWKSGLRKDVYIDEAFSILDDMMK